MKQRLSTFWHWAAISTFGLSAANVYAQSFCGYQCPVSQFSKTLNLFNSIQESSRHTPQACDEKLSKLFHDQDSDAIIGARKLMALTYGSCDVLSQPVRGHVSQARIPASAVRFDREKKEFSVEKQMVLENHPYLQSRLSESCNDVRTCESKSLEALGACEAAACLVLKHPPLYQFDQRLRDHSAFEKVLKAETGALGMDDSSFISEAFSMMGVRIRPDQTVDQVQSRKGGLSNAELWALGEKDKQGNAQDCFDRVMTQVGVRPGDVLVASKSHSVMIDTVGNDPFGIEALRKRSYHSLQLALQSVMTEKGIERSHMISAYNHAALMNTKLEDVLSGETKLDLDLQHAFLETLAEAACEHLLRKPTDYRVTIIHSSPRGGYVGIQREKVFPGLGDPEVLSSQSSMFRLKVVADCIQTLRSDWLAQVSPSNEKIKTFLKREARLVSALKRRESEGKGARILRLNPAYEGCRPGLGERPRFEASQCVRCCPTQTAYDSLAPGESKEVQSW